MGADGSQGHGDGNRLFVEPGAVPALRDVFADALARVDRQLALARNDLRMQPLANDPVSANATEAFNARAVDAAESALDTLRDYRTQLSTAVENLDRTAEQYQAWDEDARASVGKQEETGV